MNWTFEDSLFVREGDFCKHGFKKCGEGIKNHFICIKIEDDCPI